MKFKDEVLILTFEEYAKANRPSMRLDRSELKGKKAPTYHYATTEKAFGPPLPPIERIGLYKTDLK